MNENLVVWVDQNNNLGENKQYLETYSKELKNFTFKMVTSVQEGYDELKKFQFKLIYVILSGRIAEQFLDLYEENLQKNNYITLNIIFCFNKNLHQSKKYANDPFYNPGGIVSNFEDVIHYLKMDKSYLINEQKYIKRELNKNSNSFIFIPNTIENIAFPIILKKFSSRFINEEELIKFKKFLVNNYKFDNPILKNKIKIPYYLYSKFFLRIYTMESPFYRDLNIALMNDDFSDFKQYIYTLYNGLNLKVIKDCHHLCLYRTAKIHCNELNQIINNLKNSKNNIVLTRAFMSFSCNKDVCMDFMSYSLNYQNPDLFSVLYIVRPLKANFDSTVTNIDTKGISYFKNEDEITFLPFSGFEIIDIREAIYEGKKYYEIELNYLNKYEKKIKDYLDAKSRDNVEQFLKKIIKQSQNSIFKNILDINALNLINNYGNKKNVLWIDQYSRCNVYNNYITKYSGNLKNFYFERATTINEAYSILSNYEFKFIYIILNDKLCEPFLSEYQKNIKKIGVVTANIIFCEEKPKNKIKNVNDTFLNPGGLVNDFSDVVNYLNIDECGFYNILKLNKTIDNSFASISYKNIFKEISKSQINTPINTIKTIISHLPNQNLISEFRNFVYKYGEAQLSKVVNPTQEKKIDIPLYLYPKFYMRLYGLESNFYYDINKYLSNCENNFGIYDTFIKILYYGLAQNVLISSNEFPFYRGGVISKKEFQILFENLKSNKVFYACKNFLSFSKSLEESNTFLEKNLSCSDDLFPTRFIINKYENNNSSALENLNEYLEINGNEGEIMSNVEMRHYSGFATEQEVLFLPLSALELIKLDEDIYKGKKIKIIKFNYVGMLKK